MGRQQSILTLEAKDASGQKTAVAEGVPSDSTVGELVEGLVSEMKLPANDVEGRPLSYRGRLEREGRALNPSERVGDALQEEDRIVLQPNIDAGA